MPVPHSKKALGLNLLAEWGPYVQNLHLLPMSAYFFLVMFLYFLPLDCDMQVKLTGYPKLPVGVNVYKCL